MIRALVLGLLYTSGCAASQKPPTGVLVLRLAPPDARVLLDDQYVGSAAQLSGHRLRIHAGHRRIEVSAEGHYAARRDAELLANGQVELKIELHRVPEGERGN